MEIKTRSAFARDCNEKRSAWTCWGLEVKFVQTLCMPSFIDLHTHATAGHVSRLLEVEVKTLPIDRWHDRTTRTYMY